MTLKWVLQQHSTAIIQVVWGILQMLEIPGDMAIDCCKINVNEMKKDLLALYHLVIMQAS